MSGHQPCEAASAPQAQAWWEWPVTRDCGSLASSACGEAPCPPSAGAPAQGPARWRCPCPGATSRGPELAAPRLPCAPSVCSPTTTARPVTLATCDSRRGVGSWGPGLTPRPEDTPDAAPRDRGPAQRQHRGPPWPPPAGSRSLALPGARGPGPPGAQRPCGRASVWIQRRGQTPGTWQVSDARASRRHLGPKRALAHLSHFSRVRVSRKLHFLPLQLAPDDRSAPSELPAHAGPQVPISHVP